MFGFVALIFGILIFGPEPKAQRRTIHVGSKVCEVVFVATGERCTGHHGGDCHPVGYDEAVCP